MENSTHQHQYLWPLYIWSFVTFDHGELIFQMIFLADFWKGVDFFGTRIAKVICLLDVDMRCIYRYEYGGEFIQRHVFKSSKRQTDLSKAMKSKESTGEVMRWWFQCRNQIRQPNESSCFSIEKKHHQPTIVPLFLPPKFRKTSHLTKTEFPHLASACGWSGRGSHKCLEPTWWKIPAVGSFDLKSHWFWPTNPGFFKVESDPLKYWDWNMGFEKMGRIFGRGGKQVICFYGKMIYDLT